MLLITDIIVTTGAGLVVGTIIGGILLTTIIALLIIIIIILLYRNKRSRGQLDITILQSPIELLVLTIVLMSLPPLTLATGL